MGIGSRFFIGMRSSDDIPVESSDEGVGVPTPGNAELVSGPVLHVPPDDLLDCLEQDLSGEGTIPRASVGNCS